MKPRTDAFLNLLQTVAIVAGLAYGAIELTQFRAEQHRQANAELARSFLSPELMRGFNLVMNLPDSLTMADLQTHHEEALPDILFLTQTFETVGLMVYRGDVELATVDDFLGTAIIVSWNRLKPVEIQYREEFGSPTIAEWFQWLAERLEEFRSSDAPAPAYEAFKDWRPSS